MTFLMRSMKTQEIMVSSKWFTYTLYKLRLPNNQPLNFCHIVHRSIGAESSSCYPGANTQSYPVMWWFCYEFLNRKSKPAENREQNGDEEETIKSSPPVITSQFDIYDDLYDDPDEEELDSLDSHGSIVRHLLSQVSFSSKHEISGKLLLLPVLGKSKSELSSVSVINTW